MLRAERRRPPRLRLPAINVSLSRRREIRKCRNTISSDCGPPRRKHAETIDF
jgi:hypothetical protein